MNISTSCAFLTKREICKVSKLPEGLKIRLGTGFHIWIFFFSFRRELNRPPVLFFTCRSFARNSGGGGRQCISCTQTKLCCLGRSHFYRRIGDEHPSFWVCRLRAPFGFCAHLFRGRRRLEPPGLREFRRIKGCIETKLGCNRLRARTSQRCT